MQVRPAEPTPSPHMIDMRKRGGAWREDAWDRIGRMRDTLESGTPTDPSSRARAQVHEHLNQAEAILNESYWRWVGRRGARIEAAWRELRLAEETYLTAAPNAETLVLAEDAAAHAAGYLGTTDAMLASLTRLIKDKPADHAELRTRAAAVLKRAHQASDADHRRLRAVGERIGAAAIGLTILAILLVALIARVDWQFLPAVSNGDGTIEGWQGVALAMVSGVVGAMFSAIPSVSLIPDKKEPFNPVWRQAALKMAIGAWSGFVGLVVVTAGLAEPITPDPGSGTAGAALSGFVMTAALFGAGQEAVSRFADRRATLARDAAGGGSS